MKNLLARVVCCIVLFLQIVVHSATIEKTEKIEKIFRFKDPKGKNLLVVDNVYGSITVTGYEGSEIRIAVDQHIRAQTDERIEEAKEEVYLDIAEEDDFIELYVDGPFRDHNHRSRGWRRYRRERYHVYFVFDIKLPKNTDLELSTVNDGEIVVTNMDGNYNIKNVNGSIEMDKIGGSGDVYTINGDLTIDFNRNPDEESRYGSLNGEVKLYFQSDLSADFQLKTFNGDIYSDFEMTYIPNKPQTVKKRKGKTVYKAGQTMGVRVGKGGPEILLDGFNGDMYVLEKK